MPLLTSATSSHESEITVDSRCLLFTWWGSCGSGRLSVSQSSEAPRTTLLQQEERSFPFWQKEGSPRLKKKIQRAREVGRCARARLQTENRALHCSPPVVMMPTSGPAGLPSARTHAFRTAQSVSLSHRYTCGLLCGNRARLRI
jgi:hypothetical protein